MQIDTSKYPLTHPLGDWVRASFPSPWDFWVNTVLALGIMIAFVSLMAMFLVYMERKICAHFQARLGPMRVGWHGVLQAVADVLKLMLKEGFSPKSADVFAYYLAPFLPLTASFLCLTIIPFDSNIQVVDPNGGIIYLLAISGLGVFGILIGGWASNNKYSLLGAMRSGAQMISYEVSMVLGMLLIVMVSGTTSLRMMVFSQQGTVLDWWIFKLPVLGFFAFVLFLVSSTAELNRGPFDISEAESELTGGFHTEYGSMSFAMFFLAEFANMFIAAALGTTVFFGGFLAPHIGITGFDRLMDIVPGYIWFLSKTMGIILIYMTFRWTFPRLRVDQLMALEWKFLLPATLLNLMLGAVFLGMGWILP